MSALKEIEKKLAEIRAERPGEHLIHVAQSWLSEAKWSAECGRDAQARDELVMTAAIIALAVERSPTPALFVRLLMRLRDRVITGRAPDFTIGGAERPYLLRWFVIPRNPVFNIYLHCFKRSDDDRALHDHPWINCSILIEGTYVEHTIPQGGIHRRVQRKAGDFAVRGARAAHRVEIDNGDCWTLFITGPRIRRWGFHCPKGWVHWKDFVNPTNSGQVGPGCGDQQ